MSNFSGQSDECEKNFSKLITRLTTTTANVVVDDLSRISIGSVTHVEKEMKELGKDVHRLGRLRVGLTYMSDGGVLVLNRSKSSLVAEVVHQKLGDMTQEINIPTWKWEVINMDFITGLPCTRTQQESIWVIVDRVTKSAHFLAVKTTDSAQDYAKLYIHEIVRVASKISSGASSLSHFPVDLELLEELAAVYPVFHISLFKKCVGDLTSIVPLDSVAVKYSLIYEEVPFEILDPQVPPPCLVTGNPSPSSPRVMKRTTSHLGLCGIHLEFCISKFSASTLIFVVLPRDHSFSDSFSNFPHM
ncbi:hypothetical protein MTR67_034502 [Solanum verrucosum]|uniref:Uncharacterized protein n=1 Tax=Solanum verrucosum TaxID=315347 RepID=A0AAF0ZJB1_SOLVR|nr:hypothetical protein MTR67_034502 [Solanum verrucosum]